MNQRFVLVFILFCASSILAGCWNRRELNDIAIAVALGFDKSGDQYAVSAQIVNPGEVAAKKGGGDKGAPVVTYTEKGDTVFEALRKILTQSPRKIYLSHVRIVVFGEELAKEGIGKTLDFLSRDHEMRTDFFIAVAKGIPAEKTLRLYTIPQEIIPANKLFKSIEAASNAWAVASKVTLDELIADIVSEGKHPVLTGVGLAGPKNNEETETKKNVERIKPISNLYIRGMAVFKHDKLVGWLNEDESKGYNYTQGNVKSTVVEVACPKGGKLGVEVVRTKEKVKGKIGKYERPQIAIELRVEANVADVECDIDLSRNQSIYELEKRTEQEIKNVIEAAVQKAQEKYKVDIFGFGEVFYRSEPKAWKKMKKDWDEQFADLPVNVKVDVKIRRLGTITKSFQDKLKE